MKHEYRMYGWQGSHFVGKLRGYLNYKGLDYEEKDIWAYDLLVRIPRAIGVTVMPALETSSGEWFGDTPLIIEELERRHPENGIRVGTPRQKMAAMLLEIGKELFSSSSPRVRPTVELRFTEVTMSL